MKNISRFLLFYLLALSYSVSAKGQSQIQFDTITVKKGYKFPNNYQLYLAYQFIYPLNDITAINKIRSQIIKDFFGIENCPDLSLKCVRQHYESEIINDILSYPSIDTGTFEYRRNSEELYSAIRIVNTKVLTFVRKSYWNRSLAVHGGSMTFSTNFDLITGDKITVDDLFYENSKSAIIHLIWENLSHKNIPIGSIESAWLTDNFMILPKGLKFYYNEYEIAPYAYGRIDATIKYSEFKKFLKPEAMPYFTD